MSAAIALPVAINLAYWLYKQHPEVFDQLRQLAPQTKPGLGALGQEDGGDFLPGISVMPDAGSSSDVGSFWSGDAGTFTSSDITSSISPDLLNLPTPSLDTVSFDWNSLPTPDFVSASDVAAANSGLSSSTASNIGSVASVLTTGLGAVAAIANAIYKAGSTPAGVIATQTSRVAAGSNPAPITYGYNSAGQLVPILQTGAPSSAIALTPQTLSSLGIPSSWGPYILPVGIGVLIVIALSRGKKR